MKLKIAINGTGRIGLCVARIIAKRHDMELVAMNTTADIDTLVHLLKYDSVHGFFEAEKVSQDRISFGKSKNVKICNNRNIEEVDFLDATCVIECTGKFNSLKASSAHLKGNIKKIIISAPAKDTPTFVYGVNHHKYNGENVISNASCTTNALSVIAKILHDSYGIENGLLTTIHSYTNDQNLLDVKHKDKRRARAAALNMIPTSTGAAKSIGLIIPELNDKLNGIAIRVPTPNVSLIDLNVNLKKRASKDDINNLFIQESNGNYKNILEVDFNFRVSSDFVGSTFSSSFILDQTMCIDRSAKILAWYDNEVGYSSRLIDMAYYISE